MDAMSLVDALAGRRLVAEIPDGLPDWLGACEVLLQERIRAWAFKPTDLERLGEAVRMFGRRAKVGVCGVRTPEEATAAAAAGAHFLTATVSSSALLDAAGDTPIALGALTPNEVQHALDLGVKTVQIVPGEVLGMAYARTLTAMFPGTPMLATGRLERYQCDMWLDAGASFVGLFSDALFTPAATANEGSLDLDVLRRRSQEFSDIA